MISDPPHRGVGGTLVYLDSNVLVAGIVRTLALLCEKDADASYRAV